MNDTELLERARDAMANAYVPYSEYPVGAALETADGTVYTGCNVEVANYSNTLHAEDVAVARATGDGHREITRVAVTNSDRDGLTPCGKCRQTLSEFASEDGVRVLCDAGSDEIDEWTLDDLLPDTITQKMLDG